MTEVPLSDLPPDATSDLAATLVRRTRSRAATVTLREARRAIVLDFEGEGFSHVRRCAPPPALLGALIPHGRDAAEYVAYVFDPALRVLTKAVRGEWRHTRFVSMEEALADILRRAQRGRGRLVTWFSEREAQVLAPILAANADVAPLAERCFDAKAVMDSAAGRLGHRPGSDGRTLEHYARLDGCGDLLDAQAELKVEPAAVLQELARKCRGIRRLRNVPGPVRQRADDLLDYNRLDCVITRECLIRSWSARFRARRGSKASKPRSPA